MRLARRMVGEDDCARELVQEALLQAYLSLETLRDGERFGAWLCGIVANLGRDQLRTKPPVLPLVGEVEASGPDPQQRAEGRQLRQRLAAAMERLTPKIRAAARLYYFEHYSIAQIARQLGIAPGAVKARLHQGRQRLRGNLGALYEELYAGQNQLRSGQMEKAEIGDVIKQGDNCLVVLVTGEGDRCLPITIGAAEGFALALGLKGLTPARPQSLNFAARLLGATGGRLEEVRIEQLKDHVFYAVARVRAGDRVEAVDCRPSDGMALAVQTEAPLFIAGEVMEAAGRALPDETRAAMGQGLEDIAQIHARRSADPGPRPDFDAGAGEEGGGSVAVRLLRARGRVEAQILENLQVGQVVSLGPQAKGSILTVGTDEYWGKIVVYGPVYAFAVDRPAGPMEDSGEGELATLEMGRGWLPGEAAAVLTSGDTVKFAQPVGRPVALVAGDRLLGRGEVVQVDKCFGVRLTVVGGD